MARSRIGPREPVERPADLHASIPFPPMEAELVRELPEGDEWQYEPKWDGFRGLLENGIGRASPLVAQRAPAAALLPRAAIAREASAAALGARRRDRHRARRRPRLRRDADAAPSRREPHQPALRRDPRALHRVRRARVEGRRGLARAALEAPRAARAQREALRALPGHARSRRGARLARALRGDRARRRDREAARPRVPARIARRRREGEAREDGGLRRRRRALEVEARSHRDPAARPLPRRRRARLRRLGGGRARAPRRDRGPRSPAPRERARAAVLRAEPLGRRRARGVARAARSSSSRCATTRCSRTAFGTGRSSSASATTRTPRSARGTSCGRRSERRTRSPRSWASRLLRSCARETVARAAARRASSGSSADTGASPTPSFSSRSTHSSRTRRSHTASSMPACRSPSSAKRAGIVAMEKSSVSTSGSSSQVTGAETVASGRPAHRVRRRDRAIARVLVVVDEDALAALLLPPRGRHLLRQPPLDLACERERRAADDRELPVRLDPAEDVDAAVPRRLGPARVADLVEHLAHERSDLLAVAKRRPRLRIDVDAQLVRMLGVAAPRRPRVEVDDGEVRRPDHLRELGDAELVGVTARRGRSRVPPRPTRDASRERASGRSPRP